MDEDESSGQLLAFRLTGKALWSTWYSFSVLDALSRSDVNVAAVARPVTPV